MKKLAFIVGLVIIILFTFVFGMQFLKTMKSKTATMAQAAKAKAATASIKEKILELSLLLENWHGQNEDSYAYFTAHPINNQKVKNSIDSLAKEKNILLDYFIASTKDSYVIRLKPANQENLYCFDSSSQNVFKIPSSIEEIFKAKTYCKGSPL